MISSVILILMLKIDGQDSFAIMDKFKNMSDCKKVLNSLVIPESNKTSMACLEVGKLEKMNGYN